jgi:hypothetical protein
LAWSKRTKRFISCSFCLDAKRTKRSRPENFYATNWIPAKSLKLTPYSRRTTALGFVRIQISEVESSFLSHFKH